MSKTIFITGASRGIGYATAEIFLEAGYRVLFCALKEEGVLKAEKEFSKFGEVKGYACDVSDWKQVENLAEKVKKEFGAIDVLINNAGVLWAGEFVEESVESIDKLVDVNLKGVMYCSRAFLPDMVKRGNGTIINVASGAGKSAFARITVYSATKFGVVGFTEGLSKEVSENGVKVFAICPGRVDTDMQKTFSGGKPVNAIPPEKIGRKILEIAGDSPPIEEGKCLEVYS